jgi:hypothetical protein
MYIIRKDETVENGRIYEHVLFHRGPGLVEHMVEHQRIDGMKRAMRRTCMRPFSAVSSNWDDSLGREHLMSSISKRSQRR